MFCLAVTMSCSIVIFIVEMQIAFSWKCCCVALCQDGVWINTMIWQTSICQIKCQIWPSFFLSLSLCVCVWQKPDGRSSRGSIDRDDGSLQGPVSFSSFSVFLLKFTTTWKFGVSKVCLEYINNFIQQWYIKLIKSNSKQLYFYKTKVILELILY